MESECLHGRNTQHSARFGMSGTRRASSQGLHSKSPLTGLTQLQPPPQVQSSAQLDQKILWSSARHVSSCVAGALTTTGSTTTSTTTTSSTSCTPQSRRLVWWYSQSPLTQRLCFQGEATKRLNLTFGSSLVFPFFRPDVSGKPSCLPRRIQQKKTRVAPRSPGRRE